MSIANTQTIDRLLLNRNWQQRREQEAVRAKQLSIAQNNARMEQIRQAQMEEEMAVEEQEEALIAEETAIYQRRLALERALMPLRKEEVKMRKKIKENQFGGGSFLIILTVGGIKDFLDMLSLGAIGWLLNIFSGFMLAVIFFLQPRKVRKKLVKAFTLPGITESIPFLSFLPAYITATVRVKMKLDLKVKEFKERQKKIQKKIKRLQRQF